MVIEHKLKMGTENIPSIRSGRKQENRGETVNWE